MQSALEQAEGEARSLLEEQAKEIGAFGGKVGETHLRTGEPDKEIVRLSEELDVGTIVVGSRGLSAMRRALMGGVSESVVRHAHCPVCAANGTAGALASLDRLPTAFIPTTERPDFIPGRGALGTGSLVWCRTAAPRPQCPPTSRAS